MTIWWSHYSSFYFGPKYYKPAASDSRYHNRLLRLILSALTANVGPRREPDHSCMQLGPINGKHTDKFTFLLDINNIQSLYYPAIHLRILHAFITQSISIKIQDWCKCFYGTVAATASFSFKVFNVRVRVVLCSWTVFMHRPMSARLAEYCVGTGSYFRFLVRPTIS